MWLCAITGYHGLNVRIRSFTSCCATMLGNWANSPWWDLPSQWRAWHGPSPKVTFGVMMPNAGVPPDYTIMIPLLKLWNPSARSKELSSTVWYLWIVHMLGRFLVYILVSWAQIPAWCINCMQFPYSTMSLETSLPCDRHYILQSRCRKLTVAELMALKGKRQIVLTTAFDEWTARAAEEAGTCWHYR